MSRRSRSFCAVVSAAGIAGVLLLAGRSAELNFSDAQVLAADGTLRWYKGNIHTHTLWSDGDDYPEMVALWYKERGYDFLSFSDHNTVMDHERWIDVHKNLGGRVAPDKLKARFPENWVEERLNENGKFEVRLKTIDEVTAKIGSQGKFLIIRGEEISDHFRFTPV